MLLVFVYFVLHWVHMLASNYFCCILFVYNTFCVGTKTIKVNWFSFCQCKLFSQSKMVFFGHKMQRLLMREFESPYWILAVFIVNKSYGFLYQIKIKLIIITIIIRRRTFSSHKSSLRYNCKIFSKNKIIANPWVFFAIQKW